MFTRVLDVSEALSLQARSSGPLEYQAGSSSRPLRAQARFPSPTVTLGTQVKSGVATLAV